MTTTRLLATLALSLAALPTWAAPRSSGSAASAPSLGSAAAHDARRGGDTRSGLPVTTRGVGWRLDGFAPAPDDGILAAAEVNGVATGVGPWEAQSWLPRWDGEVAGLLLGHSESSPGSWTADVDSALDALWANDYGRPDQATWVYDSETTHDIDVFSYDAACGAFCSDDHRVEADSCNGTWIEDGDETCSNGLGVVAPTVVELTVTTPLTFALSGAMVVSGRLLESGAGVFELSHGATAQASLVDAQGIPVVARDGRPVSLDFEHILSWVDAEGRGVEGSKDRHLFDLDPGSYSLVLSVHEATFGTAETTGAAGDQGQNLSYSGGLDLTVRLSAVGAP